METWLIVVIVVVAVILLYLASTYNVLVRLRNMVRDQWSQIDVQLKRRFDLIPNLVETVKGYAGHEQETLEKVIEARNKYSPANTVEATAKAEGELSSTLKNLFALAESYPDLKANENFMALQVELSGTEDKIAFARQFYNDSVQRYNSSLLVFPNNIIVSLFGKDKFKEEKFFEIEDASQRENVKVDFSK